MHTSNADTNFHTDGSIAGKALHEDVNRRNIEIRQGIRIFKANNCLKVHNAPLKLPSPISG